MKSAYFMIAVLVLAPSGAFAAKHSKKTAPETYTAADPDPMEASASAVTSQQAGTAPPEDRPAPPSAGSVHAQVTTTPPPSASRWQTAPFDKVPPPQTDGISRRLHLVDEILRRYGRAYDYRTLTVKDLEMIQSELDAKYSTTSPVTGEN
jgi:hypothetical protein